MHGGPGDEVVVHGLVAGRLDRTAIIVESANGDGGSPYLVRWHNGGAVTLLYTDSDCTIRPASEVAADPHSSAA